MNLAGALYNGCPKQQRPQAATSDEIETQACLGSCKSVLEFRCSRPEGDQQSNSFPVCLGR